MTPELVFRPVTRAYMGTSTQHMYTCAEMSMGRDYISHHVIWHIIQLTWGSFLSNTLNKDLYSSLKSLLLTMINNNPVKLVS